MVNRWFIFFLLTLASINGVAQLKLPSFDVELKIHQNLIAGGGDNQDGDMLYLETTNFYGGAHVQINQHVALGGFYSRSFRGVTVTDNGNSYQKAEALQLQKGLDVRLSNGRAKKWRKYLSVNYSQVEIIQVNEAFRLAGKSNAFGVSLGIMRKLGNNLYLNVIELGVTVMSDGIFWFGTSDDIVMIDAKMGLTYNIGKRK